MGGRFLGSFTDRLPPPGLPEVAFAGRSNVGKSSAINAITGTKGLARVAKTPGRTQTLNLFDVDGKWIAVDLPGYGYAKVSHALRAQWKEMIERYLGERETLRLVVALVDARIPPQDLDRQLIEGLSGYVPVLIVGTKIDAISRTRREPTVRALAKGLGVDRIVPFSATDGIGLDEVREEIRRATR